MEEGEVLKRLEEADWETIGNRLRVHATIRSQMYPRRTGGKGELGLGKTTEDIVHEAIVQAINRERNWDPDRGELLPWLKRQVDSIMDHHHKGWHYQHETYLEAEDEREQTAAKTDEIHQHTHTSAVIAQSPDPKETLIEKEEEIEYKQHVTAQVQRIIEAADGDPDLTQLVELCMVHGKDCQKIAMDAGVPVVDIYRRMRKLRRRVESQTFKSPERMKNDQAKGPLD